MDQNESAEEAKEVKKPEEAKEVKKPEEAKETKKPEEAKETKKDEEVGWDDVQDELEGAEQPSAKKRVSAVRFDEVKKGETKKGSLDLDFILDIPLTVAVELGRKKLLINELLQLSRGSIIELTKLAGEPMEVFANNRLIAKGEVVVVNEKFGVRLTDIVSTVERINKLK